MRSLLFVPADSEKKMAKGAGSAADGLILDLEDSVAPERRPVGRELVRDFLGQTRGSQKLYVRINPLDTADALSDLTAVVGGGPDGVMLPKCGSGQDVARLDHYLSALEVREGLPQGGIRILPIVTEVAGALFHLESYIGCSDRLEGLMWGAEDLSADLGASRNRRPDGRYDDAFRMARTMMLMGARAAGVTPYDTVYIDFRDEAGLEAECLEGRQQGFLGKPAIHPAQVEVINRAFSVTKEEVAWAKRVVAAFAEQPGAGVVGLDGVMLDKPHLRQAETLLQRAEEQAK